MATRKDSDRSKLLKGTARYAWEEIKTMNRHKAKALGSMLSGYIGMKLNKKKTKPKKTDNRTDLEEDLTQFS